MTTLQAMLVSGALLTAPAAMATDLPPEGDYSVTYYNIYHPSKTVPTADNKSASITRLIGVKLVVSDAHEASKARSAACCTRAGKGVARALDAQRTA